MKWSVLLSVMIALAGAAFGWNAHQRLEEMREVRRGKIAEVSRKGIYLPSEGRLLGQKRSDRTQPARITADEFIAAVRSEISDDTRLQLSDRLADLDARQLSALIRRIQSEPDLNLHVCRHIIAQALDYRSADDPKSVLGIYEEAPGFFNSSRESDYLVELAIFRFAKIDPDAALKWFENHRGKHSDDLNESLRQQIIIGVAEGSPKAGFSLLEQSGFRDPQSIAVRIVSQDCPSEQQGAKLAAFRDYLKSIPDSGKRHEIASAGVTGFVANAVEQGFESGSRSLEAADFPHEHARDVASGIDTSVKISEIGSWIEWTARKLSPGTADRSTESLVERWTKIDYRAVDKWLSGVPESPMRETAITSFSQEAALYQPELAASWAIKLQPGRVRDSVLRHVRNQWSTSDATAAAAFAEKHGIK